MPTPRKRSAEPSPARRGAPSSFALFIGKRIRQRRTDLGWSQEVLGEKFGVGRDTVSRYETGQAELGAGELMRLAEVMGVTIYHLCGQPESRTSQASGSVRSEQTSGSVRSEQTSGSVRSEAETALLEAYCRLGPRQRLLLLELARDLSVDRADE